MQRTCRRSACTKHITRCTHTHTAASGCSSRTTLGSVSCTVRSPTIHETTSRQRHSSRSSSSSRLFLPSHSRETASQTGALSRQERTLSVLTAGQAPPLCGCIYLTPLSESGKGLTTGRLDLLGTFPYCIWTIITQALFNTAYE